LALVRDAGRYADVAAIETMIEDIERAHVEPLDATTGAMPAPRPGGASGVAAPPVAPDGTAPEEPLPEAVGDASPGWWDAGVASPPPSPTPVPAPASAPAAAPSIPTPPGPAGGSTASPAPACPVCLACAPCVCRCEGGVPASGPARPPGSAQPKTAAPAPAPKGRLL